MTVRKELQILLLGGALAVAAATPSVAQRDIIVGAKEPGSSFYTYAAAIASVLSKKTDKTGKVMAVAGAGVWLPMMENKEVDVGLVSHYQGWLAKSGKKPFPRAYDVRLVLVGGGINVGMYVRNDSPIKTRADIRGKRIAYRYSGTPAIHVYAEAEIANGGLSWKDVRAVPRTSLYAGQREDVTERRLDVFYASVGSGVTRELDATVGIRFLGVDTSAASLKRMREVYPVVVKPVKAGPPGIRKDIYLVYLPVYLITHAKVSDAKIYGIVKALWENNDALRKTHKRLRRWDKANFADDQAILPYHPGAIRFYKEKGVWDGKMAATQKRLSK
jgi:TRAP transporter TAXI family solute receptor